MEDLTLLNASELITLNPGSLHTGSSMDELGILNKASISIKEGKISSIGSPRPAQKEINVQGKVVLPGFIDPHTHLVFGGSRANEFELRMKGATYQEIASKGGGIKSTVMHTREASEKELINSAFNRLDYALEWGTTTLEVKSGYGLMLEHELKMLKVIKKLSNLHPISLIPTFLGAHEIPTDKTKEMYLTELLDKMIPEASKLAKFCDVFCEKGVFTKEESQKILERGKEFGLIPKVHADELTSSGGSELAGSMGAISADHVIHPSDEGIRLMKEAGTVVVLLPGTCLFLNHKPPVKKLLETGIPIAIGSDFNPGSSPLLAMPIIISLACVLLGLTPAQAITAATINAAHAIGLGDSIGSLEIGKVADLLILNVSSYREIPYWLGFNPVQAVIKGGQIVFSKD